MIQPADRLPARDITGPLPDVRGGDDVMVCGYSGAPEENPGPYIATGFFDVSGVAYVRLVEGLSDLVTGRAFAVEGFRVRKALARNFSIEVKND